VIGHRGAAGVAPEDARAALAAARAAGADGVELDVRPTGDGRVVVLHDGELARGGRVEQVAGVELRAALPDREVPLLDEWLDAARGLCVNVEIKHDGLPPGGRFEAQVAAIVRAHGEPGRVLVSSFSPWVLLRFRRAAPEVPIGLLFQWTPAGRAVFAARGLLRPLGVHPHRTRVDRRLVDRLHREGRMVCVWTVNDPDEACRLAALGVDAVITDRPDLVRAALG
jgi:glycerophosphoryl diester phosphodiesterase